MLNRLALFFFAAPNKPRRPSRWTSTSLGCGCLMLALLGGCHTAAPRPTHSADWDNYVNSYLDAYFAAHPDAAVANGRHEFDGKLPDWSKAGLDREVARLHSAREQAAAFSNLDPPQQFERDYVLAQIDSDLFPTRGRVAKIK